MRALGWFTAVIAGLAVLALAVRAMASRASDQLAVEPSVPPLRGLRILVRSECGGPLPGASCGWGEGEGVDARLLTLLAGPSGADGLLVLLPAPKTVARDGASLLVVAPGHAAVPLEPFDLAKAETARPADVTLPKRTRLVGEVAWPEPWNGRVTGERLEFMRDSGLLAGPSCSLTSGRTFSCDVTGCGRVRAQLEFSLDGEHETWSDDVSIDASTGSEVPIVLRPVLDHEGVPVRWTVAVRDDAGAPVEGARLDVRRRLRDESWRVVKGKWSTDAAGIAVLDLLSGEHAVETHKFGFGPVERGIDLKLAGRTEITIPRARERVRIRITSAVPGVEQRVWWYPRWLVPGKARWSFAEHDPNVPANWQRYPRLVTPVEDEFLVPPAWKSGVIVTGEGCAPIAVVVPAGGAGDGVRRVSAVIGPGEEVRVEGLDGFPVESRVTASVHFVSGVLGEIDANTPLRCVARGGHWYLEDAPAEAGKVDVEVNKRYLRGMLPPTGTDPRIVVLR